MSRRIVDVDFEHERREEVIQYLYEKYGRSRAALTATVISYRTRSALRDAGRALGIDIDRINALTSSLAWWESREQLPQRFAEAGLDPASPRVEKWLVLAEQLNGFRAIFHSMSAALSSVGGVSTGWCRSKMRRWPSAASFSGTKTISTRLA